MVHADAKGVSTAKRPMVRDENLMMASLVTDAWVGLSGGERE